MDPLSLIGGIGSAIGSFGQGILSPILGWFSNDDNNENLWRMALLQNYINQRNVDKTNALNEQLQREQWQRDDTAYQRQVKDMTAAGLNPLSQFNSPVSSPLSAGMQAAQFNVPQTSAFDFSNLGKGFSDLGNAMIQQESLNLKNKELNLKSITEGVDPGLLDSISSDDELLNLFSSIVRARLTEAEKNANSPYVKGEGNIPRTAKDLVETIEYLKDKLPKPNVNVPDVDLTKFGSASNFDHKHDNDYKFVDPADPGSGLAHYYYSKGNKSKTKLTTRARNWLYYKLHEILN